MAAAVVWAPAAVAAPSCASVGTLSTAPGGVEIAMVVMVPPEAALMLRLADWVTPAAPSMNASVVATITGNAVVAPVVLNALRPLVMVLRRVLLAASTVTVPSALTFAFPDRWLRVVLLITGVATAASPTGPGAGAAFDTTMVFTFVSACARKKPDALIFALPVTATSAGTLA